MKPNPALVVVGANPPRRRNSAEALPEGRTLGKAIALIKSVIASKDANDRHVVPTIHATALQNAVYFLEDLQRQAAKGIHRNPRGEQLARKVLRLDYVHKEDGEEYTHDFTEDRSTVTATVVDGGRQIVLKAVDGRRIVQDYE